MLLSPSSTKYTLFVEDQDTIVSILHKIHRFCGDSAQGDGQMDDLPPSPN